MGVSEEVPGPGITMQEANQVASRSDSDSDGLSNLDDNCATVPNPDQEDADGDAVGDACDVCPNLPAPGYIDGCPEGASPVNSSADDATDVRTGEDRY
jgi:hypothetical protein